MGDGRGDTRCVDQGAAERRAQKRADFIATGEQRLDSLGRVFDAARGVECGQAGRLLRPIRQRGRVQRQDLALAGRRFLPFVKPLTAFLPDPAFVEQLLDERRQTEFGAGGVIGKPVAEVPQDMAEDVDAGDVHRAERRALGAAQRGTGHRIDLFDRVLAGFERTENLNHSVQADMVRDEIRRVLGDDDAFAEPPIGEARDAGHHIRLGVDGRDDLEEPQISWWVEEVGADPMTTEVGRAAFAEGRNGNPRRVRADDRAGPPCGVDALEQRPLHLELFNDRFDDPVDAPDAIEIAIQPADGNQCGGVGREERIRLERAGALESRARDVGG